MIIKRNTLWDSNFGGKDKPNFKTVSGYGKRWTKVEKVSQKVPTPRTSQFLAFAEYSTFDTSAFFGRIK